MKKYLVYGIATTCFMFQTLGAAGWTSAASEQPALATNQEATVSQQEQAQTVSDNGALLSEGQLRDTLAAEKARLESSGKFSWVGYGLVTVTARKESKDWGKSRVIAAQKAVMKAENTFALEYGQKIATKKATSYFSDDSDVIPDYDFGSEDTGQLAPLLKKLVALGEAELNQALEELGVDPAEFNQVPPEQQHLMFKDAFENSVKREALANLSGLLNFKTYEGFGGDGQYYVAALLVLSESMKQFAYDMSRPNVQIGPNPEKVGSGSLQSLVQVPAAALVPHFGVRRLYDDQGYPVIVSYGQWAISKTTQDSKKIARKRDAAFRQAAAMANQGIAEFINSHINYSELAVTGEEDKTMGIVDSENFKRIEDMTQLTDYVREEATKKSRVNITGIRELRRWSTFHPENEAIEAVGVISYWSPVNAENMKKIREWKPGKKRRAAEQTARAEHVDPSIRGSQELMSLDDF